MKKRNSLLTFIFISAMLLTANSTFAQFGSLGNVLSTGADDAEKILEAYIAPYANGMGAGLSTGWYNTAKPHKLGGFDVTFSFNVAIIPSSDQSFDANELELGDPANGLTVAIDGTKSPTAAGKSSAGQTLTYNQNVPFVGDVPIASLDLPKGTGFAYTPMPMLQAGIGLVKETELNVRYSPNIEWGNGSKIGLWGVGLKHSIKQWIPAVKRLPLFDLTLQGGYTKLKSTTDLNFQPSFYENTFSDVNVIPSFDPNYYSNQEMLLDISNITANILVSGDFKIICIYGGVGISNSKANLKLSGNYPIPYVEDTEVKVSDENLDNIDPIDISIETSDGSVIDPRFNAGFRLKFAVVTINFDYTYADYSVASAGLGISFR